jgi:hypothetical protein
VAADEKEGLAVPVATAKGRQEGRTPPAQRKYGAKYDAVSAQEAQMNLAARLRGDLPPIPGGLDDEDEEQTEESTMEKRSDFDPLGGQEPEPGDETLVAEEQALRETARGMAQAVADTVERVAQEHQIKPDPMKTYLEQRDRVTLELADGSMSMAVIDVKQARYGITILLPLKDEGATFIPKPGSEITVVHNENSWDCFFPGTYFECPELQLLGIVFVKADEAK